MLDALVELEVHSAFELHFTWVHPKLASQKEQLILFEFISLTVWADRSRSPSGYALNVKVSPILELSICCAVYSHADTALLAG